MSNYNVYVIFDKSNNPRCVGLTNQAPLRIFYVRRARARKDVKERFRVNLLKVFMAVATKEQVQLIETFEDEAVAIDLVKKIKTKYKDFILWSSHE